MLNIFGFLDLLSFFPRDYPALLHLPDDSVGVWHDDPLGIVRLVGAVLQSRAVVFLVIFAQLAKLENP